MSYNPGLLYYKHYYENILFGSEDDQVKKENQKKFARLNKDLLAIPFKTDLLPVLSRPDMPAQVFVSNFPLTTTYPGLILGTGYRHGSGLQGEFKTGFFFDHTTGMPVIPGSSVKGLIRSAFPGSFFEKVEKDPDNAAFWLKLAKNRERFVESIIKALGYIWEEEPNAVLRLEREIFEGLHGTNREKPEHHFAMHDRDVFFDAYITGSKDGRIFSEDYITPHKNPLKNPIPIQLLKVRPGVTFSFQFSLKAAFHLPGNTEVRTRMLLPEQRLELFRQILMLLGAGAKTNSGFGHFEEDRIVDLQGGISTPTSDETVVGKPGDRQVSNTKEITLERVKKGNYIFAEVIRRAGNTLYFRLFVSGYAKEADCSYPSDKIQPGQQVRLLVRNIEGKGDKLKIIVAEPTVIS